MAAADFRREGCPNCEEIVQVTPPSRKAYSGSSVLSQMQGSSDKVAECTSAQFDGIIALTNPTESWVGRWQRVSK